MKEKENVPVFRSWTQWYVFVIAVLALLIIFFYWLTKQYS
jgi:hypothetical protein